MRSWFGPNAEQVTDRVAQLRAIERVEVEVADAAGIELPAQLGSHRGGDQLARGGKVVEPFEEIVEPLRDRCATALRKPARRRDVGDREDAGDELGFDARRGRFVAEAKEALGREEELGDSPVGT